MSKQSDFDCSDILVGEDILVSNIGQSVPTMVGYVTKAMGNSVAAFVFLMGDNGFAFRDAIRHQDDPWIKDHPQCVRGGVFTEGPGILRRRAMEKQILDLTAKVAEMWKFLEPQLITREKKPTKRGPGRPKTVVDAAVSDPLETEVT